MFECLIIGDSIAIGAQQFYPTCAKIAKGGINSWQFNRLFVSEDLIANTAIISLGSNDHAHVKTEKELLKVRDRLKAERVFWILPAGNLQASNVPIEEIQTIVYNIAGKYNDRVVSIENVQSDGIHPSKEGYKKIVEKIK
jgi:lysophospholipase L1-like esterase